MATQPLFEENPGPGQKMVGMSPQGDVGIFDPRVSWIVKQVSRAEPHDSQFKEKAKECYRFQAGKQLSDEDERALQDQKRPANAFNTAQKFIRYISGVQRDSPIALAFNAVDIDQTQVQLYGERVARYYDWALDKSDGNSERARAFEDFLICGMGWTNCFTDRSKDPKGLVGYERISPFEMLWPQDQTINLKKRRWCAREAWIENEEAKALFSSEYAHAMIDLSDTDPSPMMTWPAVDRVIYKIPYVTTIPLDRLGGQSNPKKDKSKIMEFQWWDNQVGYIFEDPGDHTEQWMTESEFNEYRSQLKDITGLEIKDYDRQIGRKWQRAFLLNRKYLLEEPSDLPGPRFTFNPMCCHFDEHDKLWYGFFRVLLDPQRYANKFFNQMIETIAKSAKAGVIVETGAFEDEAQKKAFVEDYARTGSVNFVAPDTIKESRILPKPNPETPQAAMAILDFCTKSMEGVTGLSEDSLGLGASTAAGVTIKRRQRAGMVLLAAEFDSESQFRKEEGMIIFDHLKLISDDRLIRVGGQFDQDPVIPLNSAPFSLEYEIELDEVERDPNMKQWLSDIITGPFGQTMLRMNKFLPMFLNALPIPRRWIEAMKKQWEEDAQQQMQAAAQGIPMPGGRGSKKSLPELQALVRNKDADTALKIAKGESLTGGGKRDDLRLMLDTLLKGLAESRQSQQQSQQTEMDQAKTVVDAASQFHQMRQPPAGAGR